MINTEVLKTSVCHPVIDLQPTMEFIRCFALSGTKLPAKDFKNVNEVMQAFRKLDEKYLAIDTFKQCEGCASKAIHGTSCGCLVFKDV